MWCRLGKRNRPQGFCSHPCGNLRRQHDETGVRQGPEGARSGVENLPSERPENSRESDRALGTVAPGFVVGRPQTYKQRSQTARTSREHDRRGSPTYANIVAHGTHASAQASTVRCRCHPRCRRSQFAGLGTQIFGKRSSRISLSRSRASSRSYFSQFLVSIPKAECRSLVSLHPAPPEKWRLAPIVSGLVDVRFRGTGSRSKTRVLPRLLSHCYCYADSRFSNPMVFCLTAYAMNRCSMKRKSIISGMPSSSDYATTRILEV